MFPTWFQASYQVRLGACQWAKLYKLYNGTLVRSTGSQWPRLYAKHDSATIGSTASSSTPLKPCDLTTFTVHEQHTCYSELSQFY